MTRIAFVCEGNAGRSQMAAAFAERERDERGVDVEVVSGGTLPASSVHDAVVEAMAEVGVDIGGRHPRRFTPDVARGVDRVVAMGCSLEGYLPADWDGAVETWDVPDAHGDDVEAVRTQRDDIGRRVAAYFDGLDAG